MAERSTARLLSESRLARAEEPDGRPHARQSFNKGDVILNSTNQVYCHPIIKYHVPLIPAPSRRPARPATRRATRNSTARSGRKASTRWFTFRSTTPSSCIGGARARTPIGDCRRETERPLYSIVRLALLRKGSLRSVAAHATLMASKLAERSAARLLSQ